MPTAGKAKTADMAVRTGLMRSVWHVACDVIYEELCAGRGVVVPDLGTFFIDTKESFLSTAGSTSVTRQPSLVLSGHFERLGMHLPVARPSTGAAHMLGWRAVAERCGIDRDLARRSVASVLAAFASQVAGMAASSARSSAGLDLGRCGTLRALRFGGFATGCEPRVLFSPQLVELVRKGPSAAPPERSTHRPAGIGSAGGPPPAPALSAPPPVPLPLPGPADATDADAPAPSEAQEPFPCLASAGLEAPGRPLGASDGYLSLEGLSKLMHGEEPQAWAVAPAPTAAALTWTAKSLTADGAAADGAAAVGMGVGRQPLGALPQTAPGVDEWAVSKQMGWMCDVLPGRLLPPSERSRRAALDADNRLVEKARRRTRRAASAGRAVGARAAPSRSQVRSVDGSAPDSLVGPPSRCLATRPHRLTCRCLATRPHRLTCRHWPHACHRQECSRCCAG